MIKMKNSSTILTIFFLLFSSFSFSHAIDFFVNGKEGWVVRPSQGYDVWAAKNRFRINDNLVFKYEKGRDFVLVVNKDDYFHCNTTNPVLKMDDGNSAVKLDRSGPFYFISGDEYHCHQGEKMVIVVMHLKRAESGPAASPGSPVSHSPGAIPPSGSSSAPISHSPVAKPPSMAPISHSPVAKPPSMASPAKSPVSGAIPPSSAPISHSPVAKPPYNAPSGSPRHPAPANSPVSHSPVAKSPSKSAPLGSPVSHSPSANPPAKSYSAPASSPFSHSPVAKPPYASSPRFPAPRISPAVSPISSPSPAAHSPATSPPGSPVQGPSSSDPAFSPAGGISEGPSGTVGDNPAVSPSPAAAKSSASFTHSSLMASAGSICLMFSLMVRV